MSFVDSALNPFPPSRPRRLAEDLRGALAFAFSLDYKPSGWLIAQILTANAKVRMVQSPDMHTFETEEGR